MGATITTIPDGKQLPIDSLPGTIAYSGSLVGSITTNYAGNQYVQSFLNNGTNITYFSGFNLVQQAALVTLSASSVLAAYATPQLILPFPAGTPSTSIIVPVSWSLITTVSTAFAGGGNAVIQYGNTAQGAGTIAIASAIPAADVTSATTATFSGAGIQAGSGVAGAGLYFSNITGAFTGGAGSTLGLQVNYVLFNPLA